MNGLNHQKYFKISNMIKNKKIAIIGLGYVGLPLAVEFGKQINTIGYDINFSRVDELNKGFDKTLEIDNEVLINTIQKKNINYRCRRIFRIAFV